MSTDAVPRFLLEGCALDPLLDDPDLLVRIVEARRRGLIELFSTDLTRQDLRATPTVERRERLLAVLDRLSPLAAGVPAVLVGSEAKRGRPTYPGNIYPVGQESGDLLDQLGLSARADARQALAAHWAKAVLVTDDRALIRRCLANGIQAMTTGEFAHEINLLVEPDA